MSRFTTSSIMLSGFFALSMIGLSGSAQAGLASSLQQCKGSNAGQVISCCNAVIRKSGERPSWYVQAGGRCGTSVAVCGGGGGSVGHALTHAVPPNVYCHFNTILLFKEGNGKESTERGRGGNSKR
jgi:hypothetical protein